MTAAVALACTSAIVAPSRTADGDIYLWKNRDSSWHDTCVKWFPGGKYSYTALVRSRSQQLEHMYAGINSAGLGVATTHSSNMPKDEIEVPNYKPLGANILVKLLCECKSVDEVDQLIGKWQRRKALTSNILVIDAQGNGAYFEVLADRHVRYDVNRRSEGFDVRSNFSWAGKAKHGPSEHRYWDAMEMLRRHKGKISVQDLHAMGRSYWSFEKGNILSLDKAEDDNWVIPRRSNAAGVVIVSGQYPRMVITIGHATVGMPVPVWEKQKNNLPKCLMAGGDMHALGREYVRKAFEEEKSEDGKSKWYFVNNVVKAALKVKAPWCDRRIYPSDIEASNQDLDNKWKSYARKVRQTLSRFPDLNAL